MRQLKIQQGITNRGDAAIDKYLTEIGRLELLTMDEEVEYLSIAASPRLVMPC